MLILVDSEQVENAATAYQINHLDNYIEATQFKAALNESLPLVGTVAACRNSALLGLGKVYGITGAKFAKNCTKRLLKASQKKIPNRSVLISQPYRKEQHYLFCTEP